MFIKAHIRGGYRAAAHYLEAKGKNEVSRLVHISDPDATNLDDAFHNMWQVASSTKTEKPIFHFSINPFKDERLTDAQVKRIAEAYTSKCKMDMSHHQHVIVEHIKDGRQHFHVMLNRVDQLTGKAVDPGLYKKKARDCAREMEKELGLQILIPTKGKRHRERTVNVRRPSKAKSNSKALTSRKETGSPVLRPGRRAVPARPAFVPTMSFATKRQSENEPTARGSLIKSSNDTTEELLAWAWENGRLDILAQFGIHLPPDFKF